MGGRLASVVELGALALFAIVFGLAGATLFGRSVVVAAPLPAAAAPVIPPGREPLVMELLHALGPTFAGRALGDTQIEKDEIRVRLVGADDESGGCAGPAWVQAPGGLRLRYGAARRDGDASEVRSGEASSGELTLAWFLCGAEATAGVDAEASRALERARATVDPTRIWVTVASPPAPASAPSGAGLLTPVVAATGIPPAWISVLTWMAGFASALLAPLVLRPDAGGARARSENVAPDASRARVVSWVAAALVVAGAGLRLRLAMSRALDGDEPWAFPTPHPVFTNDHDAWVHPPLFRALQGLWGATVGWHPGDALLALRAPSVVASAVALALVALVLRRVGSLVALLPLAVVALSPVVAGDGVLARPYGFAAAFAAVVAVGVAGDAGRSSPRLLSIALVALGAAIWTDLLAGLVAALLLALAISRPAFDWRARGAVVAAAAVWALPLVVGSIVALGTQVSPAPLHPGASAPDLAPVHGMGHGALLPLVDELVSFGVFGVPFASIAIGVVALGWLLALVLVRPGDGGAGTAAAPLVAIAILTVVATKIGLRTRNVLFLPHLVAIAAAAPIAALLARARRRRA
jgi:hypothetical protein